MYSTVLALMKFFFGKRDCHLDSILATVTGLMENTRLSKNINESFTCVGILFWISLFSFRESCKYSFMFYLWVYKISALCLRMNLSGRSFFLSLQKNA